MPHAGPCLNCLFGVKQVHIWLPCELEDYPAYLGQHLHHNHITYFLGNKHSGMARVFTLSITLKSWTPPHILDTYMDFFFFTSVSHILKYLLCEVWKVFFPCLENKAALWWDKFSSGDEHWTSILSYSHLTSSFCAAPTPVKFRASMKTPGYVVKNKQLNSLSEQSQNQRE